MGNAFIEALVKCKQVTRRARVGEFDRRHQFPAGIRPWPSKGFRADREKFVAIVITDFRGAILRIRISQVRVGCCWAVAIAALEIDEKAAWPPANWFHVN